MNERNLHSATSIRGLIKVKLKDYDRGGSLEALISAKVIGVYIDKKNKNVIKISLENY